MVDANADVPTNKPADFSRVRRVSSLRPILDEFTLNCHLSASNGKQYGSNRCASRPPLNLVPFEDAEQCCAWRLHTFECRNLGTNGSPRRSTMDFLQYLFSPLLVAVRRCSKIADLISICRAKLFGWRLEIRCSGSLVPELELATDPRRKLQTDASCIRCRRTANRTVLSRRIAWHRSARLRRSSARPPTATPFRPWRSPTICLMAEGSSTRRRSPRVRARGQQSTTNVRPMKSRSIKSRE